MRTARLDVVNLASSLDAAGGVADLTPRCFTQLSIAHVDPGGRVQELLRLPSILRNPLTRMLQAATMLGQIHAARIGTNSSPSPAVSSH